MTPKCNLLYFCNLLPSCTIDHYGVLDSDRTIARAPGNNICVWWSFPNNYTSWNVLISHNYWRAFILWVLTEKRNDLIMKAFCAVGDGSVIRSLLHWNSKIGPESGAHFNPFSPSIKQYFGGVRSRRFILLNNAVKSDNNAIMWSVI